jgi:chromosome segregation ATPase
MLKQEKQPEPAQETQQPVAKQEEKATPAPDPAGNNFWNVTDALDSRLLKAVRDAIESREALKHRVEEREREAADRDQKMQEQRQELDYLEKKIGNLEKDNFRLQETVHDQKLQYEQIINDYTSYRAQQEKAIQDLQDSLKERELTNRQLLLDLNRGRKDHENKMRELETRERELQVKYQHLEEKHRNAMSENERLIAIIHEFASQADAVSRRGKYAD